MTDKISTAVTYDEIIVESRGTLLDQQDEYEQPITYRRERNPLANLLRAAAFGGFCAANVAVGATSPVYGTVLVPCESPFEVTGAATIASLITEGFSRKEKEREATPAPVPAPKVGVEVETIFRSFSLTVTQAARVLGVTRPTVYEWRRAEGYGNLAPENRRRLAIVYKLAKEWEERGSGPLGELNLVPFEDDHLCLLDYLTVDDLDDAAVAKVKERLELLAAHRNDPRVAGHRALNWREAFRKQGFEESSQEERDANFEDNLRRIRYE